jgi:MFS transporter, NNP family, nitrate/nitrite transporter
VYFLIAEDTPDGVAWVQPRRQGALEVTSPGAVIGLVLLSVPVVGVLGIVAYRLEQSKIIDSSGLAVCLIILAVLAAAQAAQVLRVNRPALARSYGEQDHYPFQSVALCSLAYAVTFGGELAVLSTLPTFFSQTWHLGVATAGIAGGTFGVMNLVTRPTGGIVSDVTGRRRWTLVGALAGSAICFCLMSLLGKDWPVVGAVLLGIVAAVFLQGGNGAVFAIAPQIDRRVSGQIAGMVGAYGNVGGIVWLFLLVYVAPQTMFLGIGLAAIVVGTAVVRFLPDPMPISAAAEEPSAAPVPESELEPAP